MKEYQVTVEEINVYKVWVNAENEEQAETLAKCKVDDWGESEDFTTEQFLEASKKHVHYESNVYDCEEC